MTERLVDITAPGPRTLHTFPVKLPAESSDDAFKERALEGAIHAGLVPPQELAEVSANIHVERGGPLEPYDDPLEVSAQTSEALEAEIRDQAYALWQKAGSPDGRADDFWFEAEELQCQMRAYRLWEQDGCPEGRSEEHWFRVRAFKGC